jgi:ankyrin repeat protein
MNAHVDVVHFLLSHGTMIDHQTRNGDIALMLASKNGDYKMVQLLLIFGANIEHQGTHGATALIAAVQEEKIY